MSPDETPAFLRGFSLGLRNLRRRVAATLRRQSVDGKALADEIARLHPPHGIRAAAITDETLAEACRRVGVTESSRRDFNGRTTHAIVTTADGSKAWLKVSGIARDTRSAEREAEIEAEGLPNLLKPGIIAAAEWQEGNVSWRAVLMTLAPSDAAGRHPLNAPALSDVPEQWWADLREALSALQRVRTDRCIFSPSEISDLIKTYLPNDFPTRADAWSVQHGDLHWSNLTLPSLMLLDWEVWGRAPVGYGAGRLLVFSLLTPDVAVKVEQSFADEFSTASGQVGVLAAIAVVRRQIAAGNVSRHLEPSIRALLNRIRRGDFGTVNAGRGRSSRMSTSAPGMPQSGLR